MRKLSVAIIVLFAFCAFMRAEEKPEPVKPLPVPAAKPPVKLPAEWELDNTDGVATTLDRIDDKSKLVPAVHDGSVEATVGGALSTGARDRLPFDSR